MELVVLPTRYPQGAEKQLIQAVTGRQVPSGGFPKDVGCAVFNIATCASVCRAVADGEPILRRIVTITGHGIKEPKKVEMALWKIIPPEEGSDFCHRLVFHGRDVCTARTTPHCERCCLKDICKAYPEYKKQAEEKAAKKK